VTAVAESGPRERLGQARPPRKIAGGQDHLLGIGHAPGLGERVAACQQQVAARRGIDGRLRHERVERQPQETSGLLVGQQLERAVRGLAGVAQPFVVLAGGDRVLREVGEVRPWALVVELLERRDGKLVKPDAAGAREPVVERVADQHVGEAKAPGGIREIGHDARVDRLVEPFEQLVARDAPQPGEHVERELATEHGGEEQQPVALR
jgi:hypothetical protein